ncbi:hypothetical protein BKA62DRAFT_702731 [Auriculariales sp. MPI-PUGE-AT-0066]|nr:hypothetical protein BKA62DRAFT_702731 [Auriculariales sp. MPI-PUGE-AT-0066]
MDVCIEVCCSALASCFVTSIAQAGYYTCKSCDECCTCCGGSGRSSRKREPGRITSAQQNVEMGDGQTQIDEPVAEQPSTTEGMKISLVNGSS